MSNDPHDIKPERGIPPKPESEGWQLNIGHQADDRREADVVTRHGDMELNRLIERRDWEIDGELCDIIWWRPAQASANPTPEPSAPSEPYLTVTELERLAREQDKLATYYAEERCYSHASCHVERADALWDAAQEANRRRDNEQ